MHVCSNPFVLQIVPGVSINFTVLTLSNLLTLCHVHKVVTLQWLSYHTMHHAALSLTSNNQLANCNNYMKCGHALIVSKLCPVLFEVDLRHKNPRRLANLHGAHFTHFLCKQTTNHITNHPTTLLV